MCKTMVCTYLLSFTLLAGSMAYIYLNETGNLEKVKRKCKNKVLDLKDDVMKKVKN